MMPTPRKTLQELARSESWEERARAASGLISLLGTDEAVRVVVLGLLAEDDDTGVSQVALEALIERGDQGATDLLFEGVARADDDTYDHLLYFVARDFARDPVRAKIVLAAQIALESPNEDVREGAAEILETLGAERDRPSRPA